MKKLSKIALIVLGICAIFFVIIGLITNEADVNNAENTTTISTDDFTKMMDKELTNQFKNNYSIEWNDNVFIVSLWQDGIANEITYVSMGDEKCLSGWDSVIDTTYKMSKSMQKAAFDAGLKNIDIEIRVLNDLNLDNGLLIIRNNDIIYNVLDNINK